MKRLVILATLLFVTTTTVLAQDDYKKYEFFGGYSAMHVDNLAGDTGNANVDDILGDKQTLRGFNLEFGRNFHKYFGAKFDYSFHTREDNFNRPAGSGNVDSTIQNDQQTGIVLAPTPFQTVGSPFVIPGTRQDNLRIGAGIVIH